MDSIIEFFKYLLDLLENFFGITFGFYVPKMHVELRITNS